MLGRDGGELEEGYLTAVMTMMIEARRTFTHTLLYQFVYPSDTVVIRLRILSFVAMMGLRDDTTCIIRPTVRRCDSRRGNVNRLTATERSQC